ncbi:hypothetical protein P3W45_000302 [Vairimorpha bombi]|jgi:N-glycosylase/DNA lyase
MDWILLENDEYINLKETLFSGQVFNFYETDENEYTGSIYFFIISLLQKDKNVYYKILSTKIINQNLIDKYIRRFFTLQINYKTNIPVLNPTGLRLINNSLIATLFSFICSANNNVKRITKMVKFLYTQGEFACKYKNIDFFHFPSLDKLNNIENILKIEGFGYRSKYICKTANLLLNSDTFIEIRKFDDLVQEEIIKCGYNEGLDLSSKINFNSLKKNLVKLSGIGPKVRDCICLMGLGLFEVVPIDTHIFKHSKLLFDLKENRLTSKIYKDIQDKFVQKFGKYAGIHQLYIFKDYLH